jgi:16S rRNA processing protein RimM
MEKRVCIGKIVAAHGIRGEVKVKSYTKIAANIDKYGDVENKEANRIFKIKVVGSPKETLRVRIDGIKDRNAAEALIGTEFYVKRSVLPELKDEEYYLTDLIGLKVFLQSVDNEYGKVVGVENFGAGDILEIKPNTCAETDLLPFTKQYVPQINLNDGYIIISSATMIFAQDEEEEGAES